MKILPVNLFVSILPIVLYLLGIKAMDALSFTTWKRLSVCGIAGMLCCGIAFFTTHTISWHQPWITPLLEECLKAMFVICLVYRGRIAFFAEAMVYGMAVGAGFSLVENSLYVAFNSNISLLECGIRGFGTALIHMGCTALVATVLLSGSRLKVKGSRVISVALALVAAAAIHIVYNLFLIPPFVQLMVTVVVFIVLFMCLYQLEEILIHRWLDLSITNDIQLLADIKAGTLHTTRAGEYLIALRSSFHPEVFFDMLVFLQLYMELSIKAKSRLIMRDADFRIPIPEEEHKTDMQRLSELSILRKNIGVAGLHALSPLIHEKNTDTWVLNELL